MSRGIRKPTLDEWFLMYQLKKMKNQFHLPLFVDIDVTRLANHYQSLGKPAPYTNLLIKASALMIERRPHINKAVFHTFYGPRVIEFPYVSVNIPITMEVEAKEIVTATSIKNPHKMSHDEIKGEFKKVFKKGFDELPINKIIHQGSNNFISRLKLKFIHFMMMNFPSLYLKKQAGGISVSSIPHLSSEKSPLQGVSYGLTGATIFNCSAKVENEKTYLRVGIGYDHMAFHGKVGMEASSELCRILEANNDDDFALLIR